MQKLLFVSHENAYNCYPKAKKYICLKNKFSNYGKILNRH